MYKRIGIVALLLLLAGCTAQKNIETELLKSVESTHSIVLDEPLLKINKSTSWATVDVTQGLLPGKYESTVENSAGTFFYGSGRCYFFHDVNSGKYYLRKGGFWVPKLSNESPRLFYIVDSERSLVTTTSLDSAIEQKSIEESTYLSPIWPQPTNMTQGVGYGIGMGIVSALAESEVGNIVLVPAISDNGFTEKLTIITSSSH